MLWMSIQRTLRFLSVPSVFLLFSTRLLLCSYDLFPIFTVQSYPAEMTSSGLSALKLTAVAHPLEASPCAFLNVCTSGNSSPPSSFITKLTTFTSPLSSAMAILWYFGSSANALMSSEKVLEIIRFLLVVVRRPRKNLLFYVCRAIRAPRCGQNRRIFPDLSHRTNTRQSHHP